MRQNWGFVHGTSKDFNIQLITCIHMQKSFFLWLIKNCTCNKTSSDQFFVCQEKDAHIYRHEIYNYTSIQKY